jgi:hypothetical protein
MTAVTGSVFTAAQFNLNVRDNLALTAPAAAMTAGAMIITNGFRLLIERTAIVGYLGDFETTATATYGDLATVGPAATVSSGTKCLVSVGGQVANSISGLGSRICPAVSGATTIATTDANSLGSESGNAGDGYQATFVTQYTLTGGTNTFTLKYRTTAGGGVSTFGHRLVACVPF